MGMKHVSPLTTYVSIVVVVGAVACAPASDDSLGGGQQALTGTVSFAADCSAIQKDLLETAAWHARVITATDAFADCVDRAMRTGVPPSTSTSELRTLARSSRKPRSNRRP